ncbi:hypothetical protein LWI29_011866 [Acer saccharum]|uniref:Retrotransposon gag domain-containing protein n=1 Tax=Acer saccharum TaxID=4024 RepID=A0AA39W5A9_ACESA|nr:hypothetical protein LWI29_011866 [Acer saccharum]
MLWPSIHPMTGCCCLTFLQTFDDLARWFGRLPPEERNESIKKYLARFGKEVAQIEDASDVAVIAAFTNGLQSGRLSFDLRRERPKTYEEMMEIAGDYALAEEEEVAQEGSYVQDTSLTQIRT